MKSEKFRNLIRDILSEGEVIDITDRLPGPPGESGEIDEALQDVYDNLGSLIISETDPAFDTVADILATLDAYFGSLVSDEEDEPEDLSSDDDFGEEY